MFLFRADLSGRYGFASTLASSPPHSFTLASSVNKSYLACVALLSRLPTRDVLIPFPLTADIGRGVLWPSAFLSSISVFWFALPSCFFFLFPFPWMFSSKPRPFECKWTFSLFSDGPGSCLYFSLPGPGIFSNLTKVAGHLSPFYSSNCLFIFFSNSPFCTALFQESTFVLPFRLISRFAWFPPSCLRFLPRCWILSQRRSWSPVTCHRCTAPFSFSWFHWVPLPQLFGTFNSYLKVLVLLFFHAPRLSTFWLESPPPPSFFLRRSLPSLLPLHFFWRPLISFVFPFWFSLIHLSASFLLRFYI